MSDSTSDYDAGPHRGDSEGRAGAEARRRLIATALNADDAEAHTLVERLHDGELDAILHSVLSDPDRLEVLRRTGVLDASAHPELDRFARMAASALGTRFAAVAVVTGDRQFWVGLNGADQDDRSVPLELSLAKFMVASREPLIVDNAALHPLLARHAAVRAGVTSAYAGIPLIGESGHVIGAMTTWDERPRHWTSGQIQVLRDLADLAASKIFGTR